LPCLHAAQAGIYNLGSPAGMAAINAQVSRQAATLAYLQDFRLMMWVTLASLPLILLLRPPARSPTATELSPAME